MENTLIKAFRDKINENDMILHIYRNYAGKNKWNVITSAVDWIETSVDGIDVDYLEIANSNSASIKLITFISCIDILWEGIIQLHRVFYNTSERPFSGSTNIFHKEMDDNNYWKEIRAAFAAHPTNLDGSKEGEKCFASWSGNFGNGDFSVIVYSNDPQKDSFFFDIKLDELFLFATERYNYLNILSSRIDKIVADYISKWRNTVIRLGADDSIIDTLRVLKQESANRWENDYVRYRLEEIEDAFSVTTIGKKNSELLQNYRNALLDEVQDIKNALQEMLLDSEIKSVDDSCEPAYNYPNQHIFEPGKGMLSWAIESLRKPLGEIVDFDSYSSIKELQVLVRAGWWVLKSKPCEGD